MIFGRSFPIHPWIRRQSFGGATFIARAPMVVGLRSGPAQRRAYAVPVSTVLILHPPAAVIAERDRLIGRKPRRLRGRKKRQLEESILAPEPMVDAWAPPPIVDPDQLDADRLARIEALETRLSGTENMTRALKRSIAAELQRLRDEDDEEAAILLLS